MASVHPAAPPSLLLGLYPREFRDRFGSDLEADFGELLAHTRPPRGVGAMPAPDLLRAVPMTLIRRPARAAAPVRGVAW